MPRFSQLLCSPNFRTSHAVLIAAISAASLLSAPLHAIAQDAMPEQPAAEQPAAESAVTNAPAETATETPSASFNLKSEVEDFWHYAKIARYDLANAKAASILAAGAAPGDVLVAFEGAANKRQGDELTAGMVRFIGTPELAENAKALEKILIEGRYGRRADAKFIESNIQRLNVNSIGYQNGLANLKSSGEMAVPILLEYLRSPEKSQYHDACRRALKDLGRVALNPLVAATEMSDTNTLSIVVTILGELGYSDAAPYILKVDAATQSTPLKETCARALAKINAAGGSSDAAFLDLAEKLYAGKSAISADIRNPNAFVWFWDNATGLSRKDVPQNVFAEVMAMRASEYALELASPGTADVGDKALSLWLAANYKRQVELGDAVDPTRAENQPNAHYYGVTSGPKYLGTALSRTLNDRDSAVAYEILRSQQDIIGNKTLDTNAESESLVKALSYGDRRVRFEAAFALAAARPTQAFSGSDSVVPLLGEALSQTGTATVLIIGNSQDKVNAISAPLTESGYQVAGATSAANAATAAQSLAAVDVVVFDSTLPSDQIESILDQLNTSPKLRGSARLALVQTGVSAFEELKNRDPLLSTSMASEPDAIKTAIEDARAKGGALPIDQAIATDYALRAAGLLKAIGTTGGVYDLAAVKSTLLGSLNDARPEVVTAVGEVLSQYGDADAQRALLAKASATDTAAELRISLYKSLAANAKQYGNLLPAEDIAELEKIVTDEPDLDIRGAAAEARGSLNLAADQAKGIVLKQIDR